MVPYTGKAFLHWDGLQVLMSQMTARGTYSTNTIHICTIHQI